MRDSPNMVLQRAAGQEWGAYWVSAWETLQRRHNEQEDAQGESEIQAAAVT